MVVAPEGAGEDDEEESDGEDEGEGDDGFEAGGRHGAGCWRGVLLVATSLLSLVYSEGCLASEVIVVWALVLRLQLQLQLQSELVGGLVCCCAAG